jgi:3,4-dihydroxy 2-butanone 4-phosphate synthase/GTP cyclohydrolase II
LVHRVAEAELSTRYGRGRVLGYSVAYEPGYNPIVFAMGDLAAAPAPLVRLHSSSITGDLIQSLGRDCGDPLHLALEMIGREGVGALIYLPQKGRGLGLIEKLKAPAPGAPKPGTPEADLARDAPADPRDYGIGLQILQDLGLKTIRILTNNPKPIDDFVIHGHGLEIVAQVPILAPDEAHGSHHRVAGRVLHDHLPPDATAHGSEARTGPGEG